MPRVPDARVRFDTGPQVRTAPLQGGYMRAVDVSAPMRQVAQAANNLGVALDREAERKAEAEANKADTDITASWLQWDAQARQKWRGQQVGEYETEAQKWWDDRAEEYGKALSPRARERVGMALARKRNSAIGSVMSFANAERERFADESATSAISTTIQFGVTSGDVTTAAERVRQIAAEQGARKGWTTEQVQAEQAKHLSALHLAQITKLASTDANAARAYFEANKGEVSFTQQARIDEVLKAETDNQEATRFAALHANKTLADQLALAAEITDPARREKTIQQIKLNDGLKRAAIAEREKAAADEAWQLVGQGQRVPEELLSRMDGRERVQLRDYLRQRAEHAADRARGNATVKTDPRELARVLDLARDNPEEFKALRMETLAFKLSGSDLEQVARMQRDLIKPPKEKAAADPIKWNNKVSARINAAGLNGAKKSEERGQFQLAAQQEFEAHIARTGKPPTPEEEDKILDRLLLQGAVQRDYWFDKSKPFYQVSAEERARFNPTISSSDRALIVAALQAEGVTRPTDAQITERFKLAKGIK